MKKTTVTIVCVIAAALLLLTPIPSLSKENGARTYKAVLYSVQVFDRAGPDGGLNADAAKGVTVSILGNEIYNSVNTAADHSVC
ncbi:MAG: hypothetical protein IKS19_05070 [Clostridia bacterium]|nr:hypothetical protein [Clostridia bacterium]